MRRAQSQQMHDVVANLRRRGGGEGAEHRAAREGFDELAYPQVARAEVLPPLRHAVRLVHGDERDGGVVRELQEVLGLEALRCDVEQRVLPCARVPEDRPHLRERQSAVKEGRLDARLTQRADLVVHKGDQRGDDKGDSLEEQRGNLEAEGLPRPGGHYPHSVSPAEQGVDDLLLPGAEAPEAKVFLEDDVLVKCAVHRR